MKIRKCTVCGQEFESHNGKEVCSKECEIERRHKYEKEANYRRRKGLSCTPISYTCLVCGKQFEGLRQKYCSEECRKMGRKEHVNENNKRYYGVMKKGEEI